MTEIAKQEASSMMAIIEKVACDPNADFEKLEKLLSMQERIMDKQGVIDFNTDMISLRKVLPAITKNKRNGQTDSNYADLEAIKIIADKYLNDYNFYDRYEDDYPSETKVGTTCILTHINGHQTRNRVQFDLDDKGIKGMTNKTSIHATASSMTYGQRLALGRALGIRISEDTDGNLNSSLITQEQVVLLNKLADDVKADKAKFCKVMNVPSLADIMVRDYGRAVARLNIKGTR